MSKYAYVATQWKYGQADVFTQERQTGERDINYLNRIACSLDESVHNNQIKRGWLMQEIKRTRDYCRIHDAGGNFFYSLKIYFEVGMIYLNKLYVNHVILMKTLIQNGYLKSILKSLKNMDHLK